MNDLQLFGLCAVFALACLCTFLWYATASKSFPVVVFLIGCCTLYFEYHATVQNVYDTCRDKHYYVVNKAGQGIVGHVIMCSGLSSTEVEQALLEHEGKPQREEM